MTTPIDLAEAGPDDPRGPAGRSRIGGGPDLLDGVEWPRDSSGLHLNFLAQIDLADLPAHEAAVPKTGLLSFFIGTEFADGQVLYSPAGTPLTRHALPDDAAETSRAVAAMLGWDAALGRMVVERPGTDGLTAIPDADGRLRFLRDGAPVIALASEYEIAAEPQLLRITEGDARHQMFGHAGSETGGDRSPAGRAVRHAAKQGWTDLTDPADWFELLALRSGGDAGFEFNDHDTVIYVANRRDTAKADFARIFAYIDQG